MPSHIVSKLTTKHFADFVKSLDDREPPSIDVIVTYLVLRSYEEGLTKDDLVLKVRKAWDESQ